MFAGHIGAALLIGRAQPRVNVGLFVAAALLLDVVLWVLVLVGFESVNIPSDYARTHQAEFQFPYSHGLLAALVWSSLAAAAVLGWLAEPARVRIAALVALAVFSHWVLDVLVHRPEMPLAGPHSLRIGLGLWGSSLPVALAVESLFIFAGLLLYIPRATSSRSKLWLGVASLVLLAFTVVGMTVAPAPPSAHAMAASSLVTLTTVCALFLWLGRARLPKAPWRTSSQAR
ncbi:MAG TPA: hypothetical protein VMG11_02195 [Steroidobacteraceae bacterium]|nr:hypothetical protein [Steroidobacteraceae bacterium]